MLKKPSWLQNEPWADFIAAHRRGDGSFACAEPGCDCDADTVDHIKPRSHDDWKDQPSGSADAVSNLQPMCRSHNSSKGTRPDSYWSRNFLFDQKLDLSKLRASQNDFLYQAIREYGDEFSRPWSQINGKLFCFFQIVGAGKTLGMFALPFALNHAVLNNARGGHDEMHWSPNRIHDLVHNARNSLCFGFTASPISSNGELMDDIVKVSTFGYREALLHDNSMKGLGAASGELTAEMDDEGLPTFSDVISEIQPEAVTNLSGEVETVDLSNPVIGCELPYMLNVANGAVEEIYRLDRRRQDAVPSSHRQKRHSKEIETVTATLNFPAHAMIRVKNIKYAEYVCDYLNNRFETDRTRYPLEKGWSAVTAHGANDDFAAKTLDKESNAWFRSLREKGVLDEQCARFLVVSDMAKEGTNNKYCNVIAFAKPIGSMIEAVQVIGRGIRSVARTVGSELQVPDRYLDNIRVVTHRCFETGDSFVKRQHRIVEALRFIENMEKVEDVPSLPQWFSGELEITDPDDPDATQRGMSNDQLLRMLQQLSRDISRGKRVEVRKYQDDFGGRSQHRRAEVVEIIEGVKSQDPAVQARIQRRIRINNRIEPDGAELLIDEQVDLRIAGDKAKSFVLDYDFGPDLEEMFRKAEMTDEQANRFSEKLVPKLRSNDYAGQQVATRVDLVEVTRGIAEALVDSARLHDLRSEVHSLVNQGVRHYLGRGAGYSLGRQSDANKPAVILRLSEQGIKNKVSGWVLTKLINKNALNDFAEVIGVTPDETNSDEFNNDND